LLLALWLAAPPARAQSNSAAIGVEVWTDRGSDAVYQPGDTMGVQVRVSEDGYLLVYEIDAEGAVRVLWPERGSNGWIEGRETVEIPSEHSNLQLVVEPQTGESYVVAIASRLPFQDPPWYLRPYDPQAEANGYAGEPDDEQGVTRDGRIVGDPFVAMERIRRRMLQNPDDPASFGTAYTSYYTHERVLYPRYICSDCHRPDYWAWWDGFDPYYAQCPVFEVHVNWGWFWGPSYWFGTVPYYYYAVRPDCPPRYRFYSSHHWYSSWNGWGQWRGMMGGGTHHPSAPPGYAPPSRGNSPMERPRSTVPGYLASRQPTLGRHNGPLRPTVDPGQPRGPEANDMAVEGSRGPQRGDPWGRAAWKGSAPGRERGDDSETRGGSRGIPQGGRGGFRWVGPGYGVAPRPVQAPVHPDRGAEPVPQRREYRGDMAPPRGGLRGSDFAQRRNESSRESPRVQGPERGREDARQSPRQVEPRQGSGGRGPEHGGQSFGGRGGGGHGGR
jgi:hypothetical protein